MNPKLLIAGLACAAASAAQAQAVDSTDWTVIGSIVPSTCILTLAGGGVADFGTLSSAQVKLWSVGAAPERYLSPAASHRSLALSVSCASPTKMALAITDNRSATVSGVAAETFRFGMGTYTPPTGAPTNIGSYVITLPATTIKPTTAGIAVAPAALLLSPGVATSASTWTTATGADALHLPSGKSLGFSTVAAATTPDSLTNILATLEFSIEPLKAVVDTATTTIVLDGSGTITLVGL